MKKALTFMTAALFALAANAAEVKCYINNYTWSMTAYDDGGSYIGSETESYPADPTGNIKGGYKYEEDPGTVQWLSEYYNSTFYYDLSALYALGDITITSAELVVYPTDVQTSASIGYPTLSHVDGISTETIGTLENATADALNYVDVTDVLLADYAGGYSLSEFTLSCADVTAGTNDANYAKVRMLSDIYGGEGKSYLSVTYTAAVPEPATYAAILGALALGFAAWRRRR